MNAFDGRLVTASCLEQPFIQTFNQLCQNHQIIKYGIESTQLAKAHKFIRLCRDDTSRFIRYIPDSVLVNTGNPTECTTTLIEFKAATTGIRNDSFVRSLSLQCPSMDPPFGGVWDVFNIEKDALDLYSKLSSLGVRVVVVAFASYRTRGDRIRAQFIEKISICNVYNPNIRGQNTGSGTHIANVNFASFESLDYFFDREYHINANILQQVSCNVQNTFGAYPCNKIT
jgi:hypothetical protein